MDLCNITKSRRFHFYIPLWTIATILFFLASCEEVSIEQSFPAGLYANVNFFNASEVMNQNSSLQGGNMVYINDSVPKPPFLQFPIFEVKYPGLGNDMRQYPQAGVGRNPEVVIPDNYQVVYYMPVAVGTYRFIFTGSGKVFLKDIDATLEKDSYNTFYLTESPEADDTYRITAVPEERKGAEGKIRVRVVHLAPDAESLSVMKADGFSAGLPPLKFGSYSPYIELDTIGASQNFGNVVLKFSDNSNPTELLVSAAVPAVEGSSFIILVQGFRKPANRKILVGSNPDMVQSVTVQPNFRTNLRRTH